MCNKPENLFFIFELFQFDESRYCPEPYLLQRETELFCWWEAVSKFLFAALFANARKLNVSEFQIKNEAILRLRLFKKR